ncbi:hypothetical protein EPN90_02335 [Patescibacteria group bacterium]|nr:MAG: hypothetical protein EPN90_02335 [Patescibacteria group bacterium]
MKESKDSCCQCRSFTPREFITNAVVGLLFYGGLVVLTLWLWGVLGCAANANTYVLFAETAREDKDMARVITLRLPLRRQPPGATVFCSNDRVRIAATRWNDDELKVRRMDGSEQLVEIPAELMPVGLATNWPGGSRATRCGLDPFSPVGSHAYLEWGRFRLFFERNAPEHLTYRGEDGGELTLGFPLGEEDRAKLREHGVPTEIANLLY